MAIYVDIVGYEGRYQVSDDGRVKSLARTVQRGGQPYQVKERILSPIVDDGGRLLVTLSRDGVQERRKVSHLVLEAFAGPRPPSREACHWNDDPADNRLSNLRWGTHSDNQQDRMRNGRHRNGRDRIAKCPRGHGLTQPNLVPSSLRLGRRSCLACKRAQSLMSSARRDGRALPDLESTAQGYYLQIIWVAA